MINLVYNYKPMNEKMKIVFNQIIKMFKTMLENIEIIEKELRDIKERIAFLEREINK